MALPPIPYGQTARRPKWAHLPPAVRVAVEEHCGAAVVTATSQSSGFTPGFASVLACADGSQHFVKAASTKAQRVFADAYREEARILAALPLEAPAPRLRWTQEVDDWFVLSTEYVEARHPHRPWQLGELHQCLDMLAAVVPVLTPPPAGLALPAASDELAQWPSYWEGPQVSRPGLRQAGWRQVHHEEAAELARSFAEVMSGETLVHTDVRDDNILVSPDGRVLLCDWNWPMVGAAWIDSLFMLIGPRGDGLDVEALIAQSPQLSAASSEAIDISLAMAVGHFWRSAQQPVPVTSPFLRTFQQWEGDVCWDWLAERRNWER